ncbi:MAG: ABC transporter permease [Phycisphaeraceae bacterium]|nr:ABC transporter permease [Phycisphaerales bacterium]MCB9860665.1 ABC transporter permease [Phycisphaeraceae bacterium]
MSQATVIYSHAALPLRAYLNPSAMVRNLWSVRVLTGQFARRDIEQRYKNHLLGLAWTVIHPLIMLAVYTFVFGIVFEARRTAHGENAPTGGVDATFALNLFIGLIVFGIFREMAGAASNLIVGRTQYVKKVVVPLEIFSVSAMLVALFHFAVGLLVWFLGWVVFSPQHYPHWEVILVPVLILPVCLAGLAMSWLLSALGVFLRDMGSIVEIGITMLFFLTPVFYSLDNINNPKLRMVLGLNPLARSIESCRAVMIRGEQPDWAWWGGMLLVSALMAVLSYAMFMKCRRAFADVL